MSEMAISNLSAVQHPALRNLRSSLGVRYSQTSNEQLIGFLTGRGLRLLTSIPELSADRLFEIFLKQNELQEKEKSRVIGMIRNQIVIVRKRFRREFERVRSRVPSVPDAKQVVQEKIAALEEAMAELDARIQEAQLALNFALAAELLLLMADLLAQLVELREELMSLG